MALVDFVSTVLCWSLLISTTMSNHVPPAKTSDQLAIQIRGFIYRHEQLCGDQFRDPVWLPAHDKCEMECDMLTELCQESANSNVIKSQRCLELPKECADALKEALYAFDPSSKSSSIEEEIEKEIHQFQEAPEQQQQQPFHQSGVSVSGTTGGGSSQEFGEETKPLKPHGLDVKLIKASGVSNFQISSENDVKNDEEEEPFSVSTDELLEDFGINTTPKPEALGGKIIDEILRTSTTSFIQSKLNNTNRKSSSSEAVDKSYIDKFFEDTFSEFNTGPKEVEEEDPITIPPSPTLKYTTKAPLETSTSSFVTAAAHTDEESSFIESYNQVLEITEQPLQTVPPSSQPVGTIDHQWSAIQYKTIDTRLEMPPEIQMMSPDDHIFGPPFSSQSSTPMITMPPLSPTSSRRPAVLNYHVRGNERFDSRDNERFDSRDNERFDSRDNERFDSRDNERFDSRDNERFDSRDNVKTLHNDNTFSINRYFPLSWRGLANRLKKKPFYSLDERSDADQSPSCCQFALEGLCDRSYQRIRAMCPRSCGSVVCSSVDGALSCSRAINVDVIDCYERKRFRSYGATLLRLRQASAVPIRKITTTYGLPSNNDLIDQQTHSREHTHSEEQTATLSSKSTLQRAYAIENEIRAYRLPETRLKVLESIQAE